MAGRKSASGGKRPGAGRPKGAKDRATKDEIEGLAALAKIHTRSMLETLVSVAENKEETASARVSAATAVLDRGYGRPAQTVETSGPGGKPIEIEDVSTKELCRRVAFLFAKAERE